MRNFGSFRLRQVFGYIMEHQGKLEPQLLASNRNRQVVSIMSRPIKDYDDKLDVFAEMLSILAPFNPIQTMFLFTEHIFMQDADYDAMNMIWMSPGEADGVINHFPYYFDLVSRRFAYIDNEELASYRSELAESTLAEMSRQYYTDTDETYDEAAGRLVRHGFRVADSGFSRYRGKYHSLR